MTATIAPVALLAFALAAGALALLVAFAPRLPQAKPNDRSLHERPVPRVGGLSIWAGFLPVAAGSAALPGGHLTLLCVLAVAAVSLVDDWRGVPAPVRLAVQLAAALAVAATLVAPASAAGFALAGVVAVGIAWSANLFNFMDGSDGLAATMSIVGAAAYGAAAAYAGAPGAVYWTLAAATLPFLALNLPPARTFMGDVGSVPLGFLAAAFGVAGWRAGTWPAWFPLLVYLPFAADATVTLLRRLARGERVWEPHRTHYYQRLHQLGAGHRGTLLFFGVLMTGTATSALLTLALAPAAGWAVLAAWTAAFLLLCAMIDYHWNRRHQAPR